MGAADSIHDVIDLASAFRKGKCLPPEQPSNQEIFRQAEHFGVLAMITVCFVLGMSYSDESQIQHSLYPLDGLTTFKVRRSHGGYV